MNSQVALNFDNTFLQKDRMFTPDKVGEGYKFKLSYYFNEYFHVNVVGGPQNTYRAKRKDISDFLNYFERIYTNDLAMLWTPSISKGYIKYLRDEFKLKPTTINRKLATLRHAASWMQRKGLFRDVFPFEGVSDLKIGVIAWKGLKDLEIMRLKSACDKLFGVCTRKDQNPLLISAVFYILLHTGLREAELCSLDYGQYNGKGFTYLQRKGNKITAFVPLPLAAREHLNKYLSTRNDIKADEPLLINKRGNRITPDNVYDICLLIKKQANAFLSQDQQCSFSPHSLRHTFLKRIVDAKGTHIGQEFSGNSSIKEIFRYTRPSSDEMEEIANEIFD